MAVRHMTRALRRPDHRHLVRARLAALTVTLAFGASFASASAQAAPSLTWSAPVAFDSGGTPSAVSCASESLCVAVDSAGDAFSTSDPTGSNPFSASPDAIDHGHSLDAVACAPGGPCVAVDGRGDAFVNLEPGSSKWEEQALPNGGKELTGVSCPTSSLCVAVDAEGDVVTSTNPGSRSEEH